MAQPKIRKKKQKS